MRGKQVLLLSVILASVVGTFHLPAASAGPDMSVIQAMVDNHQEGDALNLVMTVAFQLGGWQPAPGDMVVYDPSLPWWVRGDVQTADMVPSYCSNPKLGSGQDCHPINLTREQQVRFGMSLFVTPGSDGVMHPRPVFDDLLSTYIEEVGHSWQEYLFETEGRGAGERTRLTNSDDALYWLAGREYQIKRYVLGLDGEILALSSEEHDRLWHDICDVGGYASPFGRAVPVYGSPPGWPHPEYWPTAAPQPGELEVYCATH